MAIEERLANFLKDARDWERRATNIPEKGNQYSREGQPIFPEYSF
jgi:hypothetical protein